MKNIVDSVVKYKSIYKKVDEMGMMKSYGCEKYKAEI